MTKRKIKMGRPRIHGKRIAKKVWIEEKLLEKAQALALSCAPSFNQWVCDLIQEATREGFV